MTCMSRTESARARWVRIIREQRESGETVAAFCASRGIAASSFYPWKRRLADAEGASPGAMFVEAKLGIDDDHRDGVGVVGVGGIAIELAGGRRVIVGRGFDRQLLLEVIEALEPAGGGA